MDIKARITHQPVLGRTPKWRKHGVNWEGYREELETKMTNMEEGLNLKNRMLRFNNLILEAARKHIGTRKPRRSGKTFLTPDVRRAIKNRKQLRKNVSKSEGRIAGSM